MQITFKPSEESQTAIRSVELVLDDGATMDEFTRAVRAIAFAAGYTSETIDQYIKDPDS